MKICRNVSQFCMSTSELHLLTWNIFKTTCNLHVRIIACKAYSGEKKWEFATGGDVTATPSVGGATIDPTVYVTSMDTKVYGHQ